MGKANFIEEFKLEALKQVTERGYSARVCFPPSGSRYEASRDLA